MMIKGCHSKHTKQSTLVLHVVWCCNQIRRLEGLKDGAWLRKEALIRYLRRGIVLVLLVQSRGSDILEGFLIDLRLIEYLAFLRMSRVLSTWWGATAQVCSGNSRSTTLWRWPSSLRIKYVNDYWCLDLFIMLSTFSFSRLMPADWRRHVLLSRRGFRCFKR
jgi:hypothetical protein